MPDADGPTAADAEPNASSPLIERMARVDHAWLRMDNAVNRMVIVAVMLTDTPVTLEALRDRLRDRLLPYPRFRQKVVDDALGARWVEDEDLDIAHHVVEEFLPAAPGLTPAQRLQRRCAELAMQPLDPRRPLWQWHLVVDHEGGSAVIPRMHHCIADGIALISVALALTDGGETQRGRARRGAAPRGLDDDPMAWLAQSVLRPLADKTVRLLDRTGDRVAWSIDHMVHPQQPAWGTLAAARTGLQVIEDLAALALMNDDSATPLKGKLAGRKRVAWNEPLPLARVKALSQAFGASINDVLLTVMAGALGQHLRDRGQPMRGCELRAMVPVNLRPMSQAWKLGNRFGLVPLLLPVGIENPVARLDEIRARMGAFKGSTMPLITFGLLASAGLAIKAVQDVLLGMFSRKTTAVMTNVPGPSEALHLCGAKLRQVMFWVPATGDVGLGLSILSYAGGVQFGLISDEAVCDDPQAVVDGCEAEFERLEWLALMLPWQGRATKAS